MPGKLDLQDRVFKKTAARRFASPAVPGQVPHLAPDLYVAVGIREAANHTIGIEGARTIVAVNPDPDAAIFTMASVGFVADFRPLLERVGARL